MVMTSDEVLDAAINGKLGELAGEPKTGADAAGATADAEQPAPIASKSGTYTIPFQKLVDARAERDTFKQQVEALHAQIQTLTAQQAAGIAAARAAADDRAAAGVAPTAADANLGAAAAAVNNGADISLFGDFSEEALAAGMAELNRRNMEALRAEMRQELEPLTLRELKAEADAHYASIYQAHPDADEIPESAEFKQWHDGLSERNRRSVDEALQAGSTSDVIDVFNEFKHRPGAPAPQAGTSTNVRPEVAHRAPVSLSEMGGAAPVDETQQVLQKAGDPQALMDSMLSKTPAQIEALLNRI